MRASSDSKTVSTGVRDIADVRQRPDQPNGTAGGESTNARDGPNAAATGVRSRPAQSVRRILRDGRDKTTISFYP